MPQAPKGMTSELELHRVVVLALAFLLIVFIAVLLRLQPSLANERLEEIASLVVVILAGGTLVIMGVMDGVIALQFGSEHRREMWAYLSLALASLASGLFLALSDTASLQTIALVASPHAFLFGVAQLRAALHLRQHRGYKRSFIIGGVAEIGFGIVLLYASTVSNRETTELLGFVAILTVMQLLPLVFYSRIVVPSDLRQREAAR